MGAFDGGMGRRGPGTAVRKNVTLTPYAAETLEALSRGTGMTQGDVLVTALERLAAAPFGYFGSSDTPAADVLDAYQSGGGRHMTQERTEAFLRMLHDELLPGARVSMPCAGRGTAEDPAAERTRRRTDANRYLAEHMRQDGVNELPAIEPFYEAASAGNFVSENANLTLLMTGDYLKVLMREASHDEKVYLNDYLMRTLVVLFRDVLRPAADGPRQYEMLRRRFPGLFPLLDLRAES